MRESELRRRLGQKRLVRQGGAGLVSWNGKQASNAMAFAAVLVFGEPAEHLDEHVYLWPALDIEVSSEQGDAIEQWGILIGGKIGALGYGDDEWVRDHAKALPGVHRHR